MPKPNNATAEILIFEEMLPFVEMFLKRDMSRKSVNVTIVPALFVPIVINDFVWEIEI
jgi:hypothetical protein